MKTEKAFTLNKYNVDQFAWQRYHNIQMFNGDEFFEDMKTFFYVKKLLTRYKKGESENHHLTLNHIITLNNLFGPEATRMLLRYYIPKDCHSTLNAFFSFLSILPENEANVKLDGKVTKFLKSL